MMEYYVRAAIEIFGTRQAEKWLDINSDKLQFSARSVREAKREIYLLLDEVK